MYGKHCSRSCLTLCAINRKCISDTFQMSNHTYIIDLVKTSFLVSATLPLHLDTKGDPEKRKSLEAHWVGLNLFCFQKLNK